MSIPSRYVVGLDLGTTNCAVSYVDTHGLVEDAHPTIESFPIPQLIKAGEVEEAELLPSFLYLPAEGEIDPASMALPWAKKREFAIGRFARDHGATVPTRLVSSSKSWLCHPGVDRRAAILPWSAEATFVKISPVEAGRRILEHIRDAWNHGVKDKSQRLEEQDIILTVPASFDAVARELTIEAARQAGLEHVTLFEEPQAAFYAWLHQSGEKWRKRVHPGDAVLVVDVGGGTSDFSVIGVSDAEGDLVLERIAVGDHLLLGGDNMDLALAHRAAARLKESGAKLDTVQMLGLWHAARAAKEKLFSNPKLDSVTLTVLGRGRKVVGGAIKTELSRDEVQSVLVDGFFPRVDKDAEPVQRGGLGLQELGLPYVSDPAVTKHLAAFLARNAEPIAKLQSASEPSPTGRGRSEGSPSTTTTTTTPNILLFNGGVFEAELLRDRVRDVVASWGERPVHELSTAGLDRAVAIGAAYYGMVRRGRGVRIRGGVARSYYIGVETSMPAVPGIAPPIRAVCVVPQGTEEGTDLELPAREFGLVLGEEVEFRFLGSTSRKSDQVGAVIDDWEDSITELAPVRATLEPKKGQRAGQTIPVRLHGKVTEVGTLELWCQSRDTPDRWKLEFNVRQESP